MYQCKHEYLVDTKFNIDKYDNRWYNNHAFHEIHGVFIYPTSDIIMLNRSEFVIHDEIIINSNEGSDGCNHYDQFEECDIDQHSVETRNDGDKITYQELMSRFTELARTVQNNQTICASVIGTVNKMISLHRSNTHFNVDIVTTNTMDTHAVDGIGKNSTYPLPVSAVTNSLTRNVAHMKRKKSRFEHMRSSKPASTSGNNPNMIHDQNILNPLSQSCNSIESCYVIDPLTGKATSSQPLSQSMASNDSNFLAPPKVKKDNVFYV